MPTRSGSKIRKAAAVAYLGWGLLHLGIAASLLATRLFGPADAFADQGVPADTSAHATALIVQNNLSLLLGTLIVIGVSVAYGWRGFRRGYWALAGITTLFWFEFLVLELVPGHLSWSLGIAPAVLWLVANALGAASWRREADGSADKGAESPGVRHTGSGRMRKGAAIAYMEWGVMHLGLAVWFIAMWLFGPDDAFAALGVPADTAPHVVALLLQNNVTLLAGSLLVIAAAFRFGWRGARNGYWVLAAVTTWFWTIFLALELMPGHVPWSGGAPPAVAWAVATTLGAIAWRGTSDAGAKARGPASA